MVAGSKPINVLHFYIYVLFILIFMLFGFVFFDLSIYILLQVNVSE